MNTGALLVLGCVAAMAACWVLFGRVLPVAIGTALVRSKLAKLHDAAGLVCRSVPLPDGTVAWIRERAASPDNEDPPLLSLPGATTDIDFIGARLSSLAQALPGRRIVIVELPYHGRNTPQPPDFSDPEPSFSGLVSYVETVREALGMDGPLDLLGYSLGGGLAARYAVDHGDRLRRLVLLAPFFYEASSDAFTDAFERADWRSIHGWETFDEMLHFYQRWLGMPNDDAPPRFVLEALHALRTERYPPGYWSAFFVASDAANTASRTLLTDRAADFAALDVPTLVVTASQDAVCDPAKLAGLPERLGAANWTVTEVNSGHLFAGSPTQTLFDVGLNDLKAFLQG